jgi:hypothetical protein
MTPEQKAMRILLFGWLAALASRVTIFAEGGAGGIVSVSIFWACTLGLITIALVQLLRRRQGSRPIVESFLVLIGLLAFISRALIEDGPAADLTALVFLLCIAILVVMVLTAKRRNGHTQSPPRVVPGSRQ